MHQDTEGRKEGHGAADLQDGHCTAPDHRLPAGHDAMLHFSEEAMGLFRCVCGPAALQKHCHGACQLVLHQG